MEKEKTTGKVVDFKVLKRLLKWIRPYTKQFYLLVFLTLALAVLGPVRPLIIQLTIDNEVAQGDYQGLINMIILLIVLLVAAAIVQYAHTYLSGWLGQYIIRDIRVKLFAHIQELRLKFFDKTPIGRLVTRNISDIETLAESIDHIGLIQPVVISENYELLSGYRRLHACKTLGWETIEVKINNAPVPVLNFRSAGSAIHKK